MIHLVPSPERDNRTRQEKRKTHRALWPPKIEERAKRRRTDRKEALDIRGPFLPKRRRQENERTRCQTRTNSKRHLWHFNIIIISCAYKQKATKDNSWKPTVPMSKKQHNTNCAWEQKVARNQLCMWVESSTTPIMPASRKQHKTNYACEQKATQN